MSKALHQAFETYLQKNDSRYTTQKKLIFTEILKTKRHFEVEAFLNSLNKKNLSYSRATVYRTIKQLLDAHLIQKVSTQDGKVFYEPCKEQKQHDHIICKDCGKIFEILEPNIETFLKTYCEHLNFDIEYRSLHVYGVCGDCKSKKQV